MGSGGAPHGADHESEEQQCGGRCEGRTAPTMVPRAGAIDVELWLLWLWSDLHDGGAHRDRGDFGGLESFGHIGSHHCGAGQHRRKVGLARQAEGIPPDIDGEPCDVVLQTESVQLPQRAVEIELPGEQVLGDACPRGDDDRFDLDPQPPRVDAENVAEHGPHAARVARQPGTSLANGHRERYRERDICIDVAAVAALPSWHAHVLRRMCWLRH